MSKISRENLSEEVYAILKAMILNGQLKPGEKLLEEPLAARLGVSRTPLRQAIAALAQNHLVALIPRKGAFVFRLTKQDIIEIYDIRMALEGLAIRLATPVIPDYELERIALLLDKAETALETEPELAIYADTELHELGVKYCRNARLEKIIAGLRDGVHTFRVSEGHQPDVVREVMKERWHILNALRARNAEEAEAWIVRHIRGVKERRLAQLPDAS